MLKVLESVVAEKEVTNGDAGEEDGEHDTSDHMLRLLVLRSFVVVNQFRPGVWLSIARA